MAGEIVQVGSASLLGIPSPSRLREGRESRPHESSCDVGTQVTGLHSPAWNPLLMDFVEGPPDRHRAADREDSSGSEGLSAGPGDRAIEEKSLHGVEQKMRELIQRGNGRDDRNFGRARPGRQGEEEKAPGRGGDPRAPMRRFVSGGRSTQPPRCGAGARGFFPRHGPRFGRV